MLRCIQRPETDPYYNIAAEEYLLKNAVTDTFMTWRNEPSVIVGKHQNASKEINHSFVEALNLPVIRRITGGGTVYHDPGNINFSFIYTDRKENLVNFKEFTLPVINFLDELGLKAVYEGKNNITVDGLKVSGNSAHIYKNKVLHHGTLLFDAKLDMLEKAIAGREELFRDKAVRSVRKNVLNIRGLLKTDLSADEFNGLFRAFIIKYRTDSYEDKINLAEKEAILKLVEEKYKTYRWNFGYSPEYLYHNELDIPEGKLTVSLHVKDGLIYNSEIKGPGNYSRFYNNITGHLAGAVHEKKSMSERLKKLTFANEFERNLMNQIIDHLF
jgi:lipoate-protein ligase A